MRNMSNGTFKKGDRVYDVQRDDSDGKLHLHAYEITDVIVTKTPTGRERKPVYKAVMVGMSDVRNGSEKEMTIVPNYYYSSATNAVSSSLKRYFEFVRDANSTPEERLMNKIFGETPNPKVVATQLVDVIYDLKNYHALYAEAFAEDDKMVQAI